MRFSYQPEAEQVTSRPPVCSR